MLVVLICLNIIYIYIYIYIVSNTEKLYTGSKVVVFISPSVYLVFYVEGERRPVTLTRTA